MTAPFHACPADGTTWNATSKVGTLTVSVADLQRLHLHHLRFGAPGVAVDLETLASVRALTTKELVDEIEAAARDPAGEVGGWASFVVRYVRAAIEAGLLDVG